MSTRVHLIAPQGMLGRAFSEHLSALSDVDLTPVGRSSLDLADPASLEAYSAEGADVVINCAAYTNVDGAESEEALATRINGDAVGALARACASAGATLIHFSTDYVFDGHGTEPYPIDAAIDPLNAYGRSKAAGEAALEAAGVEHLLIRTSWVYAPWGKNFVRTMARMTAERDALKVVDDQRGRPTSAEHLARTSWALHGAGGRGRFHATDGGQCTWHSLAEHVKGELGTTCNIAACTTEEYPLPAPRPPYSVLDLSRAEELVGSMPDWRANVSDVLRRLEA